MLSFARTAPKPGFQVSAVSAFSENVSVFSISKRLLPENTDTDTHFAPGVIDQIALYT
jgi:hypothetical protein